MDNTVDVVISGVGGGYPGCRNIEELKTRLLANDNLVQMNESRWRKRNKLGVNPTLGVMEDYLQFDNNFFGLPTRLSTWANPVSKRAYEKAFEAIIDAGLTPISMRGSRTNVYSSSSIGEEEASLTQYMDDGAHGYAIMGSSRSMLCNRISYFFDLHGESVSIDGGWASGQLAIFLAWRAIIAGECDAALVHAGSAAIFPHIVYQLKGLGRISEDGLTRSFDADASGSQKSDSSVCMLLQRGDLAKRCYGHVVGSFFSSQNDNGSLAFDPTLPNPAGIARLLQHAYKLFGVDPLDVTYLDADGCANQVVEEAEMSATDAVLGVGRDADHPLLVGSVKSNLGMTDAACGLVSLSKLLVAMETGTIPATINCRKTNPRMQGVAEGRLRITTENVPISIDENTLMATTSLGLIGTLGHTVLRPNLKSKKPVDPDKELPRLVPVAGRTEICVNEAIQKILSTPFDPEYLRLVQDVFTGDIRGYEYRSYVICPPTEEKTYPIMHTEKHAVWFVYSGMGSQWAGMGQDLMRVPICAQTIDRLHNVLLTKGVCLKTILTEQGDTAFNNILKSFVGITAIQIALTNVLTALGIKPDGIIGHSVGEVGCSYADGCLTEEQTILAAYARGKASNDVELVQGMMAAVGLGYKDVLPRLPPGVEVACHNSSTSCTLTGVTDAVNKFVKELTEEGIFARTVNVSNIAYHSQYIQPAGSYLMKYLKEVIPNPKPRSSKWISTSVPESKWDSMEGKLCSAEYHTNNLLGSVLFEEGLKFIPQQAVLIEVAPHGLLQAILKRALPNNVHIPLTQRGAPDGVNVLLNAVGKMYMSGMLPEVSALYPPVEFPVSRGTPSLAPLVGWYHDTPITFLTKPFKLEDRHFEFTIETDGPSIFLGGRDIFPLSELLGIVFEAYAKNIDAPSADLPITFRDVYVKRWIKRPSAVSMNGLVSFLPGSGRFEVIVDEGTNDWHLVLWGYIEPQNETCQRHDMPITTPGTVTTIDAQEVFADMASRGITLSSKYQTLTRVQLSEEEWNVTLQSDGTWAGVIEPLLQIVVLRHMQTAQTLQLPRVVQRLDVNPVKLFKKKELTARFHLPTGIFETEGLYLTGLSTETTSIQQTSPQSMSSHRYQFVSQGCTNVQSTSEFLTLTVQMTLDTVPPHKRIQGLVVLELQSGRSAPKILDPILRSVLQSQMGVQVDVQTVEGPNLPFPTPESACLVVSDLNTLDDAVRLMNACGGLLLTKTTSRSALSGDLHMLVEQKVGNEWLAIYKHTAPVPKDAEVMLLTADQSLPNRMTVTANRPGILVWRGEPLAGVQGIVEKVRKKTYGQHTRLVFILDESAPEFSLSIPEYANQLRLGLQVNVLRGGVWGSWRKLPVSEGAPPALSTQRLDGMEIEFLGLNVRDRKSLCSKEVSKCGHKTCLRGVQCYKGRAFVDAPVSRVYFQFNIGEKPGSGTLDYVGVGSARRVMGVARWMSASSAPRTDPVLSWAVPEGWTAEQAATVPYVYSMAFHALLTLAHLRAGESVLVHEGASPVGQAALRIAIKMGCTPIFTTAANDGQRSLLVNNFPQLDPRNVLSCTDLSFEWAIRTITKGRGVDVLLSALPDKQLRASLKCMADWGRFVHYGREDMLAATTFGTHLFLRSVAVFGLSGDQLFYAREDDRRAVARAVQEGLDSGVVKPVLGARTFATSALQNALSALGNSECSKVVLDVKEGGLGSHQCSPLASYLLVGGSAVQCLQVAGWLALNGARNILAAPSCSPGDSILQRASSLRDMFGANVTVLDIASWDARAAAQVVNQAAKVAPIDAAIVFVQEPESARVPPLLHSALARHQDAALVVLSADCSAAYAMSTLCEERRRLGLRGACLAGGLHAAPDFLCRFLAGGTPPVTLLHDNNSSQDSRAAANTRLLKELPRSVEALAAMGKAVPDSTDPRLREIPTLGLRSYKSTEAAPIIAFPPLGVLLEDHKGPLHTLAANLLSPVISVEAPVRGDLVKHAAAVVKTLRRARPHGPYTLLGWSLGTPLTLQVARQLEESGMRVVTFLVDGDVEEVRAWARGLLAGPEGDILLPQLLGQDESCAAALERITDSEGWTFALTQLLTALPPAQAAYAHHVESALSALRASLEAVVQHEPEIHVPVRGKLHFVRHSKQSPCSFPTSNPNILISTLPKSQCHLGLAAPWLAEALNDGAALSKMVNDDEVRQIFSWSEFSYSGRGRQ